MTIPSYNKYLNKFALWQKVLNALQIEVLVAVLPCTVVCPFCQKNSLTIYQDTIDHGQWHYCLNCKNKGDMLQLASKVWLLDFPQTIAKLAYEGITGLDIHKDDTALIQKYIAWCPNVRANADKFWEGISNKTLERKLAMKMGVASNLSLEEWKAGGASFLASVESEKIDEFIGLANTSLYSFGLGRDIDVLVMPFYSLPGRLSSFLFYREKNGELVATKYYSVLHRDQKEFKAYPGINMIDNLLYDVHGADDTVLVMLDPIVAAKAQVSHLSSNAKPLPLVSIWPSAETATFLREHSSARKLVLWSPTPDANLFRHAQLLCDTSVALPSKTEEVGNMISRLSPAGWLAKMKKEAKSWETALEETLGELSLIEAEGLINQLYWPEDTLSAFMDSCTAKVKQKCQTIYKAKSKYKRVHVKTADIIETEDGLQIASTSEVICEASVKLDKIVHYDDGKIIYHGEVIHAGKSYPFTAEDTEIEENAGAWLKRFLIKNNAGVISYDPYWSKSLLSAFTKLSNPEIVSGLNRCGWHEKLSSFVLPDCIIRSGGKIETQVSLLPNSVHQPKLPKHAPLTAAEVKKLAKCEDDVDLVWVISAFVLRNILSSIYFEQQLGMMCVGPIMKAVEKIAKHAGVRLADMQINTPERWYDAEKLSDWPILFSDELVNATKAQRWMSLNDHNCIVPVDYYSSRIYSLNDENCNWVTLEWPDKIRIDDDTAALSGRIIVEFLCWLAKNRFGALSLLAEKNNKLDIGKELLIWLEMEYHIKKTGLWFRKLRVSNEAEDVNFLELACSLLNDCRLDFVHRDFSVKRKSQKPAIVFIPDWMGKPKVFIPKLGLNQAIVQADYPPLNLKATARALAKHPEIIDFDCDEIAGWAVDERVWNDVVRSSRGEHVLGVV